MRQLLFILFQIDEAGRYIEDGRAEQLRLALLLLDNAAELQLERRVQYEMEWERHDEVRRRHWLRVPEEHLPTDIAAWLREWHPLSKTERKKLDRDFNLKIDYLSERWPHLDAPIGQSLKRLHKYRNEAYHEGRLRLDTLRSSALLLLELTCQLLARLPIAVASWTTSDDYTWFEGRFGLSVEQLAHLNDGVDQTVLDELRRGLIPTDEALAHLLSENLHGRFQVVLDLLDYIVEATDASDPGEALKGAQFRPSREHEAFASLEEDYNGFDPPVKMESLVALEDRILAIAHEPDRFGAFAAFAEVEELFEPAETAVVDRVHAIDDWINLEIDRRRGN